MNQDLTMAFNRLPQLSSQPSFGQLGRAGESILSPSTSPTNSRLPSSSLRSPSADVATATSTVTPTTAPPISPNPSGSTPPLAPPHHRSSRKQEPILPHAPVTAKAPATRPYWSKTPVSGRLPRGLRAHSTTVVAGEGGGEREKVAWCFGGCDIRGACTRDVWKLDLDSFTWSKPKVVGELPPVTRAHTTTLFDDRLFVFGGGDGPTYYSDTYCFDTLTLTWTKPTIIGTAPSRRRAHTSVLYKSRIYIFGGGNGAHALNDLHVLDVRDLTHLTWSEVETKGKKPIARGYHSMTLIKGTAKCIVFGGSDGTECFSDVFILDLKTFIWTEVPSSLLSPSPTLPTTATLDAGVTEDISFPRLSHSAAQIGSYIFITGGHDGVQFSSTVLLLNLVTLQFESRAISGIPPSPRGYHTSLLHDYRLLLIGGFDGQAVYDEVWSLDLAGAAFLCQITEFEIGDVEKLLREVEGEG